MRVPWLNLLGFVQNQGTPALILHPSASPTLAAWQPVRSRYRTLTPPGQRSPPSGRTTSSSRSPTPSRRSPGRCPSSTSTRPCSWRGCFFFERSPWPTLTLIVSLEAIFLSTFVMIGQNRQAVFAKAKADHDFNESELELKTNTELTRQIQVKPLGVVYEGDPSSRV